MISGKQAIKSVGPQLKHVLVDDLCTSVVQFQPSPVKRLLWDLDNINRNEILTLRRESAETLASYQRA